MPPEDVVEREALPSSIRDPEIPAFPAPPHLDREPVLLFKPTGLYVRVLMLTQDRQEGLQTRLVGRRPGVDSARPVLGLFDQEPPGRRE